MQKFARTIGILFFIFSLIRVVQADVQPIPFEQETLDNGLRVIYAPMHNAPVVHVRVLYHVGSRDEKPDRQGFAHMFEHMMFRGSAHVAPEQHMKMIGVNGGISNAFTSFDQTTYHDTVPSNALQMSLYLEADRMASFKVNDNIFQTERKVVAEEWRLRYANQPLGPLFLDFLKTAFTASNYRWTPIGDMDQLRKATSSELQEFFNTYYVPNNACLIIAGDLDTSQAKAWVHEYFGWIPKGADVPRVNPAEPNQTETHKLVVWKQNVPLTNIYLGFKTTDYKSDDHYALSMLGDVLGSGHTGELSRKFVDSDQPTCLEVEASDFQLEDQSLFIVNAVVGQGKDADQVEKDLLAAVYEVADKGITQEELDKVRTQARDALIVNRQTCTDIATELGEAEVFGGDANRVNTELKKIDALTPADIQNIAKKYLVPQHLTIIHYRPDPLGIHARKAAASQTADANAKASETKNAGVVPSTQTVAPRVVQFPPGYPTEPPTPTGTIHVEFNKGVEQTAAGLKVITLSDHRLPLVNVSLIMPGGGESQPPEKIGIDMMTAQMLSRGSAGIPFLKFAADLESRGISIDASAEVDTTRLVISCTTDQLDYAIGHANQMLTSPDFPQEEFEKLKQQSLGELMQSLSSPSYVADTELRQTVYDGGPQGRVPTPQTTAAITLDDVKNWYKQFYQLDGAFLIISGDVTPEQGQQIAQNLLKGFDRKSPPPAVDYSTLKPAPATRKIILVDNPEGRQATVRMGIRAYDIHTDEKFAGGIAGQILSAGIESRLNKYVRAEKGLTYGCRAVFVPARHSGSFSGSVDTNPDTTAAAIEAMFKVFNDMRTADVTDQELADAKSRVSGGMVMQMQTIAQQATLRAEGILNGYPVDYYDVYPQRVAQVTADQVKDVMAKYAHDDAMIIVVVAPASVVKTQLDALGTVEVMPMPLSNNHEEAK